MSRRRRKKKPLARTVLKGLFGGIALGLLATFSIGGLVLHLGLSPVLTGSMRPAYSPGDAVITRPVDVHSLRAGDIAVFVPPGESAPLAHRITGVTLSKDGHVVVTTRGDANPAPDPWRATLNGSRVPEVVAVVPYLGRPMTWLGQPWLHAAALGALGLLLTAIGTRAIFRTPPRREAPA